LRTVYILGAGFSYEAGIPLQTNILNQLHATDFTNSIFAETFPIHQGFTRDFIGRVFELVPNPSLEDVFTIIDQSIQNRYNCYGYSIKELEQIRKAFYTSIVMLFNEKEKNLPEAPAGHYRLIAGHLIERRISYANAADRFSIISINWDCVLENAIYWCLERIGAHAKGDVNYTCCTFPLDTSGRHTCSVNQEVLGLNEIKFMKLHGSVNWLLCPNCNRLYVGLGLTYDEYAHYLLDKPCPACEAIYKKSQRGRSWRCPTLEPFIITPTFAKDFTNFHIQMIWHHAYRELCEAEKVVFIGYSLPEADYHLRTLLKRAIQPGTQIDIVLVENDKVPEDVSDNIRAKYAESRFRAFFGSGENVRFYFDGMRGYFSDILNVSLEDRIEQIKQIINNDDNSSTDDGEIERAD
jgi:hypothetical protein